LDGWGVCSFLIAVLNNGVYKENRYGSHYLVCHSFDCFSDGLENNSTTALHGIPRRSTCDVRRATCDVRRATCDVRKSTPFYPPHDGRSSGFAVFVPQGHLFCCVGA